MDGVRLDYLNQSIIARFEIWQRILAGLVAWSIYSEDRERAKTAMSITQTVIVACRASRKYQRDIIPAHQEIAIKFQGFEWNLMRTTIQELYDVGDAV